MPDEPQPQQAATNIQLSKLYEEQFFLVSGQIMAVMNTTAADAVNKAFDLMTKCLAKLNA